MQWILMAVGAFYAFAGVVVLRRMAMNRVLDLALEAITLQKTDYNERLQSSLLAFGGCLTLASGLALMTLSPWATVFFAANAIFQGGYLLWAWKALPPESEAERKGRQQTINAFIIYLAAFAFVAHAHSQGVFSHWPINAGNFTWLVELMVIVAVSAGLWAYWFFHIPRKSPSSTWTPTEDAETDIWDHLPDPPRPERLRLAPEYGCWPTWDDETGLNVNPADLGLSDNLLTRLKQWDDALQATYNMDDPEASRFADDDAEQRWRDEGLAIATELEREWPGPVVVRL